MDGKKLGNLAVAGRCGWNRAGLDGMLVEFLESLIRIEKFPSKMPERSFGILCAKSHLCDNPPPARVVKLVYTADLKSAAARLTGSSPVPGTITLPGMHFLESGRENSGNPTQ